MSEQIGAPLTTRITYGGKSYILPQDEIVKTFAGISFPCGIDSCEYAEMVPGHPNRFKPKCLYTPPDDFIVDEKYSEGDFEPKKCRCVYMDEILTKSLDSGDFKEFKV